MADYQEDADSLKETDAMISQGGDVPWASISIQRPAYTNESFDKEFHREDPESTPTKKRIGRYCTSKCSFQTLLGFFPFITLLRNYKWKQWIVSDIIAGLSVGVIHIPQGMGFALLTSLPAVYGLYASFFPVVIYFFFGTSHHISVGTMAVISLMIGAIVEDQTALLKQTAGDNWGNTVNQTFLSVPDVDNATLGYRPDAIQDLLQYKIGFAMSVTIIMGVFQFLMGILNLGILATFMSMPFVSGFMTGAAFHIATSQVPFLFGLKIARLSGVFNLPKTYVEIFRNISKTIPAEIVCGLICITILVVLKEIINEKFKDKLKVPIPAELIVVVLATLVSYLANLNDKFNVRILNDIPRGIPVPSVPHFINWQSYVVQSFVIAVVSFAVSISMAKIFTRKHNYSIDTNQELIAYGLSFGIGGFFNSFGGAVAPPRSVVQDSTGGKTQVASLVSSILVLLVCVAIGPLFASLPNSALAAIIIVALFPMFKLFKDAVMLWGVNKYDFTIWFVTWASVVFLDVTLGLVIGLGVSLITIVIQGMCTHGSLLASPKQCEIYVPTSSYKSAREPSGIKVFRFSGSLYFVNVERFKLDLYKQTVNPLSVKPETEPEPNIVVLKQVDNEQNEMQDIANGEKSGIPCSWGTEQVNTTKAVTTIIVDCSAISYADYMGASMIKMLQADYKKVGIRFVLACCGTTLMARLEAVGLLGNEGSQDDIFPTVHDAVIACSDAIDTHV